MTILVAGAVGCGDSLDNEAELQEIMSSELLRLAAAEQQYFADSGTYSIDDDALVETDPSVFLTVQFASTTGWGAEANHAESRNHCAIYEGVGDLSFLGRWSGIVAGEPMCKPIPTGPKK